MGIKDLFSKNKTAKTDPQSNDQTNAIEAEIQDRIVRADRAQALEQMIRIRNEKHTALKERYPQDFIKFGDFAGDLNVWFWSDHEAKLTVGNYCSVGVNVSILLGGEHDLANITNYTFTNIFPDGVNLSGAYSKGDVHIGNDVLLSAECKIMSGVTIGDGAVIGANALVTKDIPPYAVAVGVPAKVIKYRFDPATIDKLLKIKWWDWPLEHIYDAIGIISGKDVEKLEKYYQEHIAK